MIGIIGGSGVYDPEMFKDVQEKKVSTEFGEPSDAITIGKLGDMEVAFMPRHGAKHSFNPSNVNYRANIWAFKELGVTRILAVNAVGSEKDDIGPGTIVFANQLIDRTYDRKRTFYDKEKVCHINVADPFCPELREKLIESAKKNGIDFREKGTYVCIEGPRFSTRAESRLYRSWGADIIGMTACPEAVLAREAEICYANISMVTDYDTFKEQAVTNDKVLATMKANLGKVKELLATVIPLIPEKRECGCGSALQGAFM